MASYLRPGDLISFVSLTQLELSGKRNLNREDASVRLACGQVCEAFSKQLMYKGPVYYEW